MNKNSIALTVGILILVLVLAGLIYVATREPEPMDLDEAAESEGATISEWEQFSDPQFTFSFSYPPEATASIEGGRAKITYLGEDNMPATEITDGFTFYVQTIEHTGISQAAQAAFGGETQTRTPISEPQSIPTYGRDAYRFAVESELGPTVTHVILEADSNTAYHISYIISGDTKDMYQNIVEAMIATLTPAFPVSG